MPGRFSDAADAKVVAAARTGDQQKFDAAAEQLQQMPGVVSAAALTFVPLVGMFFVPLLVGGPTSVMIAPLIANQMQAFQLGLGAAMSFIVALIVLAAGCGVVTGRIWGRVVGIAIAWRLFGVQLLGRLEGAVCLSLDDQAFALADSKPQSAAPGGFYVGALGSRKPHAARLGTLLSSPRAARRPRRRCSRRAVRR